MSSADLPIPLPPDASGLIFDCDGTLADTMPLHVRTWVQMLAERDRSIPEQVFYDLAGVPSVRIVELLNQRYGTDLTPDAAERKERLFEEMLDRCEPIHAVVDLAKATAG